MSSTLIPSQDLVPSVSSRIVTIDATSMLEATPDGDHHVDFILPQDLHVAADNKIIMAGSERVTLDAGKGSIRLPTYDPDAKTVDGSSDWVILVKKSWTGKGCNHGRGCGCGGAYAIRVPVGTTNISLADLPAVRALTPREQQYAITGVSVTVTTGAPASGTGSYSGGILDLDFTLPMGNDFVKGTLANGTDWNTVTEPGMYRVDQTFTYTNTPPIYSAGKTGILMVWGATGGAWGGQDYLQHGGFQGERAWRTTRTIGTWNPWQRPISDWGRIPDGTDISTLRVPGTYRIEGAAHAGTLTNLPPVSTGTLTVHESGQSSGMFQTQVVHGTARSGVWYRASENSTGAWGPWLPLSGDFGNLPGYTDLDTVRVPGAYRVTGASIAGTLTNSPIKNGAATLVVYETGQASALMQTQLMVGTGGTGLWQRHVLNTTGAWSEWVDLLESTQNYWAQHANRVAAFTRRRGGVLGTGGVGAVAFRFDHNFDPFMERIAPLVEQYGIVSSMAVPGMEFDPSYRNASTVHTWADMERWALRHGMEIMSHSYSHDDAQTLNGLDLEIRYSRFWLENRMPGIKVDVWAHPGVSTQGDDVAYMGLGTGVWNLHESRAGRMLMGNYAVVGGHADGYFRELNGSVDQALTHYTIETETSASNVIGLIDQAASTGTGLVLMMHPNIIGTSGNMSTTVLGQIFAHVASLREQGRIVNTTVGGMSLADSSSSRRRNIAENPFFVDGLDRWAGAGWTIADGRALSPANATPLSQGRYWSRRAALAGSWHELVVDVASTGGAASVTARVWDDRDTALVDHSRTVALPSDGSFTQVRVPFGISYAGGANTPVIHPSWSIARASGARVSIRSVRVEAI